MEADSSVSVCRLGAYCRDQYVHIFLFVPVEVRIMLLKFCCDRAYPTLQAVSGLSPLPSHSTHIDLVSSDAVKHDLLQEHSLCFYLLWKFHEICYPFLATNE